ncbi:hypothetical protein R3P38DRAFT_3229679 [Favolaschia claudopus]|uniref:Uncharacterized protein n=1 Tax=Favolaschia claudopus TaxID=2862362 RepID=A0AAV9ZNN6_9AGAR
MPANLYRLFVYLELSFLVFRNLSLKDLVLFSHSGAQARKMFRAFMATRFDNAMSPFIPRSILAPFRTTLRQASAVIVGSVSASFIRLDMDTSAFYSPVDLNILTPNGTSTAWALFFQAANAYCVPAVARTRFNSFLVSFKRYKLPGIAHPRYITIGEVSNASVLPAVFYAETTAQMTMLTCERVVIPYDISLNGLCVAGLHADEDEVWFVSGYKPFTPAADLQACGAACRYIDRESVGFSGMKETEWSLSVDMEWQDVRRSNVKWRLGNVCDNRHCPNSGKKIRLSH